LEEDVCHSIDEVDFIIHETDTTTKPFPSIREVVTPSRKSTTTPQSTIKQTTTTPQPTVISSIIGGRRLSLLK
jgi:hypothetical protein